MVYRVLQRVYNMQEVEREANDPYSDDNKAPFYRQPIGLRRVIKEKEKEEAGNKIHYIISNSYCLHSKGGIGIMPV